MNRASGVLLHISSLPGAFGEGAFSEEAKRWIDDLASGGFSYWQVLPFCLPDEVNSPYKSYSAFSLNPFFIDLKQLFNAGLLTQEELNGALQTTPYVCEFDRLNRERMALLGVAAARYRDNGEMDAFFGTHPHTADFCEFMALDAANGGADWQTWKNTVPDAALLRTWRFTQFIFFKQWMDLKAYANKKGIKIIGDIPIYVSLDSSDVRSAPEMFQLDRNFYHAAVAGVPPDYFAVDGQLWGNPLYDWNRMEKDGFAWWRDRIGFMCELFDGVRIDHFRAISAYYSISATEKTARNGKWIKGPGMKFIKAIREACGDRLLIAEDLGDITPDVAALVKKSGCPGMRVLQFGFFGNRNSPHLPHSYPENCIAYTGTHDNNTRLGYIWDLDDETLRTVFEYFGCAGEGKHGCFDPIRRCMLQSHAGLVIFPVQDLLLYGADTRMNKPGVTDGNWGYRVTEAQLSEIDWNKFRRWNEQYGRI